MFAHLHTRSWFSFLAGGSSPEALAARAGELGMGALALTDLNGVYGAVRFQKACQAAGIAPVIGAEVRVRPPEASGTEAALPLVLLCRTARGYANLCRILTSAHLVSREMPRVTLERLAEDADDLICLTGGRDGHLFRHVAQGRYRDARRWLAQLREVFPSGRLYAELTHNLRPHDTSLARKIREVAIDEHLPVVATGDVRYAVQEHYRRYDLLTCIRLGWTVFNPHPERPVNAEAYLKSEEALRKLMPWPEAFEATADIVADCSVDLLPGFVTPPHTLLHDGLTPRELLEKLCREALTEKYGPDGASRPLRESRPARGATPTRDMAPAELLEKELGIISGLDLEEYFLVVREVVAEARRRGIRCAGRGSAANSIVAYLLGITGVDPIRHNLLFERFLHGGRKGTPDIDVDFDSERREEVIAWMEERFGIEQTAMTANVTTYQLRMALRDTAKALGWPLPVVDRITAAVPSRRARNVREYRETLAEVAGESPLFEVLLDMVESLDECPRHLGLHSGGMLLSRRPLFEFTPIQVSANGVKEAQFDKNDVEAMGLIKLDVLGLRMLATLSEAVELVRRFQGEEVDIDNVRLDDEGAFELIRSGRTVGVFQIESQGQMHLLAQHQPETFDDLVSEIALFRPGPLQGGMVNPFVRRRRGLEPVRYEHPDLEPVLRDTYGVILFQEQVLEVAHHFAGMTLQEADDFRSLMSKFRDPGEMEGMRSKFVQGAVGRGVPEETANAVFDKVSNFVGYGFCRSHAAAFAKTVFQSAWLKRYYPAAYMAAVMQHRPGMYNLMTLEEEARRLGVDVLLPDVNESGMRYELRIENGQWTIDNGGGRTDGAVRGVQPVRRADRRGELCEDNTGASAEMAREDRPGSSSILHHSSSILSPNRPPAPGFMRSPSVPGPRDRQPAIRKPLTSIKGVSPESARAIVMARLHGPFASVEDFYRRVGLDRDILESIARSGALDGLAGDSRRALWEIGVLCRRLPDPLGRAAASIQAPELFGVPAITEADIPELPQLDMRERLSWDYQTHGASRLHPMILLRRMLNDLEVRPIETCRRMSTPAMRDGRRVPLRQQPVLSVAGIATLRQMPPTAAGVMFIMLEDETGFIQCIVLPEMQEKNRAVFRSAALIVKGRLQGHGAWRGLVVEDAWPLENAIGGYEGYPSSYGGTDRRVISADGSRAGATEYARDLMREVEELRKEVAGRVRVDAERR